MHLPRVALPPGLRPPAAGRPLHHAEPLEQAVHSGLRARQTTAPAHSLGSGGQTVFRPFFLASTLLDTLEEHFRVPGFPPKGPSLWLE